MTKLNIIVLEDDAIKTYTMDNAQSAETQGGFLRVTYLVPKAAGDIQYQDERVSIWPAHQVIRADLVSSEPE